MVLIVGILLFIIFLLITSIHTYWAFGGRWGSDSVLPTIDDNTKVIMPGKIPTLLVTLCFLGFGVFILAKSGWIEVNLPSFVNEYGLWVLIGIFMLRAIGDFRYVGFFKSVKHTKFGKNDTKYYAPLCFLIGILMFILALEK